MTVSGLKCSHLDFIASKCNFVSGNTKQQHDGTTAAGKKRITSKNNLIWHRLQDQKKTWKQGTICQTFQIPESMCSHVFQIKFTYCPSLLVICSRVTWARGIWSWFCHGWWTTTKWGCKVIGCSVSAISFRSSGLTHWGATSGVFTCFAWLELVWGLCWTALQWHLVSVKNCKINTMIGLNND